MSRPVLVDLSHAVDGEGCQYPGLPAPVVSAYRSREETAGSYSPAVSFLLSRVDMATNVGTYIDSPYHRYESGTDLAGLSLEQIAAAVPGEGNLLRPPDDDDDGGGGGQQQQQQQQRESQGEQCRS